jgi:hypothetical protein
MCGLCFAAHKPADSSFSHYIILPKKSSSKMSQPMQYSYSTPADMCKGKTKLKVHYIGGRGISDAGCWSSAGDYFRMCSVVEWERMEWNHSILVSWNHSILVFGSDKKLSWNHSIHVFGFEMG